jgi:hypothetical protein
MNTSFLLQIAKKLSVAAISLTLNACGDNAVDPNASVVPASVVPAQPNTVSPPQVQTPDPSSLSKVKFWKPAEIIAPGANLLSEPASVIDANGDIYVVWLQEVTLGGKSTLSIVSNRYTLPTGWGIPKTLMSDSATSVLSVELGSIFQFRYEPEGLI